VRYLPFLLLLWATVAFGAEVYQWRAPDGSISFSDKPQPGAKKLEVPPLPTYGPSPALPSGTVEQRAAPTPAPGGSYSALQIVKPQNGSNIFNDQRTVPVEIIIAPALDASAGDRVLAVLDGQPLDMAFESTTFQIAPVDRGTHTLSVRVVNSAGKILIESPAVTFDMKPHSLLSPQPPLPEDSQGEQQSRGFHTQPQSRIQQPAR
jgi:hypothetical protein